MPINLCVLRGVYNYFIHGSETGNLPLTESDNLRLIAIKLNEN